MRIFVPFDTTSYVAMNPDKGSCEKY